MKTIIVKNNKGGVGKTTMSVNLAALLAKKQKKVLIIDTDERANTTRMYIKHRTIKGTIGSLLLNKKVVQECIVSTIYDNIDLIPATNELILDMKELESTSFIQDYENLKNKLNLIANNYDYCIIDCSQKLDLLALNTLFAADLVLIPTKGEGNSLVGVLEMVEVINQVNAKRTKELKFKAFIADKERNNASNDILGRIQFILDEESTTKTTIRHQAAVVSLSVSEDILIPFTLIPKFKNSGIVQDMKDFMNEIITTLEEN